VLTVWMNEYLKMLKDRLYYVIMCILKTCI